MTQSNRIKQLLKSGQEVSYRLLEVEECINSVGRPLKQAINELKQENVSILAEGYPRINLNTGRDYRVWHIKRGGNDD